jgi:signal transduction histidine kinase
MKKLQADHTAHSVRPRTIERPCISGLKTQASADESERARYGLRVEAARSLREESALVTHLHERHGQPDLAQQESVREDERRRLAADLHDYVEQMFFAIGLTATAALDSRQQSAEVSVLTEALQRVSDLSSTGAEQLRSAIFALRQPEYSPFGLVHGLRTLATAFERRSGVDTDLVLAGREPQIQVHVSETVYAIAREALANVERHARASSVVLTLHFCPRSLMLAVHDNGCGASRAILESTETSTRHFGLAGLR